MRGAIYSNLRCGIFVNFLGFGSAVGRANYFGDWDLGIGSRKIFDGWSLKNVLGIGGGD